MTKQQKRENLAMIAYPMLIESGIDKFSLNMLLAKVSMSKGNFYHYFKDKYDLFYEVMAIKYQILMTIYHEEKSEFKTSEEKIFNFFSIYLDESNEIKEFLKLMHDMYFLYTDEKNTNFHQFMVKSYEEHFLELESMIQKEIENGYLKEEAIEYVKPIMATADGMFMYSFVFKNFSLKDELSLYLNNILNNLKLLP